MSTFLRRLYWLVYLAIGVIGQARYPYVARRRIERDRDCNVRRMVRHAVKYVPYYRDLFNRLELTPGDIRTFGDLRKLPLVSVDDIRRDPEAFQSTYRQDQIRAKLVSSGSTGSPRTIWHDLGSVYTNSLDSERDRRMIQRLIGKGWRYKTLSISGTAERSISSVARAGTWWPKWLGLRRAHVADTEPMPVIVRRMNEERPDLLTGYGSMIAALFMYLDERGEPFHRPAVVHYDSDTLTPTVRRMIEEKYGIPVFSEYQTSEALKLAWECELHSGLHVNADHYPTRIVDSEGNDVAEGEVGEVVVSNLTNHGTVLLNFRQGDLATRIDAPCPCGRSLPRIGYLQGRSNDWLISTDGNRVSFRMLERILRTCDSIWQWQVVQEARDRIVFWLRLAPEGDRAAAEKLVIDAAHHWLGEAITVEVRFVEMIEQSPSAKLRHVINKVQREVHDNPPAQPGREGHLDVLRRYQR